MQSTREEINILETGRNYEWPYREGLVTGPRSKPATIIGVEQPPVIDFDRSEARTIIGGYVYRGTRFPELSGRYIAGDYSTDKIWAITLDLNSMTATKQLLTTFPSGSLGTFGQDRNGEIYLGDVAVAIPLQRLDRIGTPPADPPGQLSQIGAFLDTATFAVDPAAVPYDLVPFWSDGALKQRWLFLPNDGTHDTPAEQIAFSEQGNWSFPTGTVAMKQFDLGLDETNPAARIKVETRFLVFGDDGRPYGLTYRWRPDQSDADLLTTAETGTYTIQLVGGGSREQTWLYPSRNECLQCHTNGAGGFLGLRTHQQNRDLQYPSTGRTDNQLRTWNALGMFTPSLVEAEIPGFLAGARLDDPSASLEHRARSWLDSNCSGCHRPETGNRAAFDARLTTPLVSQGLVWGSAIDGLGIADPYLVHPGDPLSSTVFHRAAAAGGAAIAMPPLAKELADDAALEVLGEWITRIDPGFPRGGVAYEYYEQTGLSVLPDFDALTPVTTGSATGFDISLRQRDDDFAFRFRGVIRIDVAGTYTFYTSSDDGSRLYLDDALVVDNDGLHSNREIGAAGRTPTRLSRHRSDLLRARRAAAAHSEHRGTGSREAADPFGLALPGGAGAGRERAARARDAARSVRRRTRAGRARARRVGSRRRRALVHRERSAGRAHARPAHGRRQRRAHACRQLPGDGRRVGWTGRRRRVLHLVGPRAPLYGRHRQRRRRADRLPRRPRLQVREFAARDDAVPGRRRQRW